MNKKPEKVLHALQDADKLYIHYKKLSGLPDTIKLNVDGKEIETDLKILTSINGSVLKDIFKGNIFCKVDSESRPILNAPLEPFKDMLEYLKHHRCWLPSKKGSKIRRDLAETEIRRWRVDKGLGSPGSLMVSKVQEMQKILNSPPDMTKCNKIVL